MSSYVYETLNKLRQQKRYTGCDVIFQVGAHEFPVHRAVLIARMNFFRNILTEDSLKNEKFTVALDRETIDSTYFSDFLNYLYTSEIDLTNENIQAIFKTANYFRFDELIDKVEKRVEMTDVSYFGTIFKHFFALFWHSSMNGTSNAKLISTSKSKSEGNERLEEMFHHCIDWILGDKVNPAGMLLELLKNIPLKSLSFDFLKAASHYELIRKDRECLKLLFDSFITASKADVRNERRQKIDNLYATYVIGGMNEETLSSVSEYNSATHKWTATTPMPTERTHFGCAVIGHKIYVCGGSDGKRGIYTYMNVLTVFDTYTRAWTELTSMKHERELCAAAVFNEQIYVAGGRNGTGVLAVVERYNVQTDQWSNVAPMTTKREAHELVALNGFLYAIGGSDDRDILNSVERYDPQTDQWIPMNNTNNKYKAFGSAVLNSNIYIVEKNKFEVYSPADDRWTEMPAPSKCYHGRRLAVYDGQLYAIGGVVGPLKKLKGIKTVEVYDMQARVWRTEPNMDVARCFHGVAVIKKSFFAPMKLAFDANNSLNKLRLQNTGCDVILEIGGHEFPTHREVLIARLEHFRNILTVHTEQENTSVISLDLRIIDSTIFGEVLNYIYTSEITFTTENIRPIYRAAEYFRFDELINELEEHMEFTVNIDNVRSYLSIAIELCLKSLQRVFAQFIIQQIFSDINKRSRQKLIPTLPIKHLKELLQRLKETGRIEDMFHFIVDWIAHNQVNRSRKLLNLLKNIPLQKLSSNFLIEIVSRNDLVRNNIECLNLLLDAVISTSNSRNESHEDSLYAIGGRDRKGLSSVSQYNSTTRKWTATTPMPSERSQFGCAVIGHKIYVFGGYDEERSMNELTVFDTLTRTWTQLKPMKHARQNCGVSVLKEQIYVAGGFDGTEILAVVERYNVHTGQWENVVPMTTKRNGLELVVLNGFLYAIGGYDGNDALNSVERYDSQTDQWTSMTNTINKYQAFGSAVLNDNIYIAGRNKCEVYNPAFKRWIEISAPNGCNYSRRLAVINGKLYAIGGKVKEGGLKGSKNVEVYDSQARVWRPEPDMEMDVARCFHCVAVVKN